LHPQSSRIIVRRVRSAPRIVEPASWAPMLLAAFTTRTDYTDYTESDIAGFWLDAQSPTP